MDLLYLKTTYNVQTKVYQVQIDIAEEKIIILKTKE